MPERRGALMRVALNFLPALPTLLIFALTSGCGEKSAGSSNTQSKLETSRICLGSGCHELTGSTDKSISKITGASIPGEWLLSLHNKNNGAGCKDCHEPETNHPFSSICDPCHGSSPSAGSSAIRNPDQAGKCAKCHTSRQGFGVSVFNSIRKDTLSNHFNNLTGAGYPASYVTSATSSKCSTCHNPHDTSSNMATLRTWARSGHGDNSAAPWTYFDFKSRTGDCNRCHTTTGFVKYITTGDSTAWGSSIDKSKEVLMCSACHENYSYKLRTAGAVTAVYAGGSVTYPDMGASNLCLNCHTGRTSGDTIKNVQRNYTSTSFVNSHYLTAGGTVFGITGYEFSGRNYADPAFFAHRYIGTPDGRGKSAASATSGPCVGCHLSNKTQPGEKHTFKPYITGGTTLSPTCKTCHEPTATQPAPFDQTLLRDTWQAQYQDALAALKYMLASNPHRKLKYIDSNPYFSSRKWHSLNSPESDITTSGMNNMGAAFNFNMLIHDKGGVAHNRYYTRRLIYDSIDWLDDNLLNNSVANTLDSLPAGGDTAFKARAFTYLIKVPGNTRY